MHCDRSRLALLLALRVVQAPRRATGSAPSRPNSPASATEPNGLLEIWSVAASTVSARGEIEGRAVVADVDRSDGRRDSFQGG